MRKNNLTGVLVLLVFAVFMVSVLFVLLTGADLVQGITERDQRSYDRRTVVQYLTTRIRQADRTGAVSVSDDGALIFQEDFDGIIYETSVYCHEGYLRELFCEAGYGLSPEFGEEILPVKAFQASREGSVLYLTFEMPDGTEESAWFHLRSEQEVLP